MGLRFRKSIKIMPGVRVNLGKKSVGLSVGNKYGGFSMNSRSGARSRVSLPGTGLSYTQKIGSNHRSARTTTSQSRSSSSRSYSQPGYGNNRCRSCGAPVSSSSKFCANCGAPQTIAQVPTTGTKKPFYKRWWFWVILVLLVLGKIGNSQSKDTSPKSQDSPSTKLAETTAIETSSPTEDAPVAVAEEESVTTTIFERGLEAFNTENTGEALDNDLATWLGDNLGNDYVLHIRSNEVYIAVFPEGSTACVYAVRNGDPEQTVLWDAFADSIIDSSISISEAYGRSCLIDVSSDQNHHISFIRAKDGEVTYEAVHDW